MPADCGKEKLSAVNWYLEGAPHTLPSSVTVRREAIQEYPHLFAEGYKMFGDNIGWCRFAKKHPTVGLSDTPTALYRYWEGNASSSHNVANWGMRSKAVQMALARHAELSREEDCPREAKLYFRDFAARKDVVGKGCTRWMRLWAGISRLTLCAMRWGVRMCSQSVERKMRRLAKASRINFN